LLVEIRSFRLNVNPLPIAIGFVQGEPHRLFAAHKQSANQAARFVSYPTAPLVSPNREFGQGPAV
jgi:hypothetical protein